MEKETTLGRRLLQIMEERGLNYDRLGRLLEMKPQTLNRYALGQREPKAGVATEMAMKLGVNPLWLQGYDVPRVDERDPLAQPGERLLPILGTIRAGIPTLAQQEVLGYMGADVSAPQEYFYLRVQGDSMQGAGIQTGDLVLIHVQQSAQDGQIVACILDRQDATLKRFHRQGDWVILQPENPSYSPRIVPVQSFANGEARIIGVAVRLTRNL